VARGKLRLSFDYNRHRYDKNTLEQLADRYKSNLIKLIDHCAGKEEKELTVSDYSAADIDEQQLEDIFAELEEEFS
jgi:non-ribosomal peptide synthase protein (TIGR01720 family)